MPASKSKTKPQEVKISPIKPLECKLLQHAHNTHCAVVSGYLTVAQLENEDLWAHVASTFKTMDRLQVTAKDGSMIAFGLVTFAQGRMIRVKFYEQHDIGKVSQPVMELNGFIIRQINAVDGHEIVKKETGEVLKNTGLPNQTDALNYLNGHFRALSA